MTQETPQTIHRPDPIRLTLQGEGASIAAFCILIYAQMVGDWGLFALLILGPDLFMLGYFAGPRIGAIAYNCGHSYLSPLLLWGIGWAFASPMAGPIALIWGAHIGLDRAIGYGLKYPTNFKDTHLARLS